MRLGVEYPVVQTDEVWLTKYEVKVLERLAHPVALHDNEFKAARQSWMT